MDSLMVLGELKPQGFPGGPEGKASTHSTETRV